jgi:hypothetical protein
MRAQTVNFERGKDPKSILRIGHIRDVEELREDYDRIMELVQIESYLEFQKEFTKEVSNIIPNRLFCNHGWGNIHLSFNQLSREELYDFDKLIEKYFTKMGLKESVNFERGKEPKEAMKIGLGQTKLEIYKALKDLKKLGINAETRKYEGHPNIIELIIPELEDHQVSYLPEEEKNWLGPGDDAGWVIYDLDDGELLVNGGS